MTANKTQFTNLFAVAFTDNVTDPFTSTWYREMDQQLRYNVLFDQVDEVTLNNTQVYTFNPASLAAGDWIYIVIRCVGQGYVTTHGNDASSSPIVGNTPIYGTSLLPGILFLSTYNLTSNPTVTSQADNSVFEIYVAKCLEDGQ